MLLPLLSDIFGASSLLLSLSSNTEIPESRRRARSSSPPVTPAKAIFSDDLGGSVVGLGSWRLAFSGRDNSAPGCAPSCPEEFLVSIAGVDTDQRPILADGTLCDRQAQEWSCSDHSGAYGPRPEHICPDDDDNNNSGNGGRGILSGPHQSGSPGRASHIPAQLSAALPWRAGLFGGHDLPLLLGLFGLFIFFLPNVVGLIAPIAGIHRTHAMGGAGAAADPLEYI